MASHSGRVGAPHQRPVVVNDGGSDLRIRRLAHAVHVVSQAVSRARVQGLGAVRALLTEMYRNPMAAIQGSLGRFQGYRVSARELLGLASPAAVGQLAAFREVFASALLPALGRRPGRWVLGAEFSGSALIKSDADLIAAGLLLDLKTDSKLSLGVTTVFQVIGYALLDFDDSYQLTPGRAARRAVAVLRHGPAAIRNTGHPGLGVGGERPHSDLDGPASSAQGFPTTRRRGCWQMPLTCSPCTGQKPISRGWHSGPTRRPGHRSRCYGSLNVSPSCPRPTFPSVTCSRPAPWRERSRWCAPSMNSTPTRRQGPRRRPGVRTRRRGPDAAAERVRQLILPGAVRS
jgi:hypothetical protein